MTKPPSLKAEILTLLRRKPHSVDQLAKASKITREPTRIGAALAELQEIGAVVFMPDRRYAMPGAARIDNLALKVAVLERLEPILAPDIEAVLKAIRNDLLTINA